MSSRGRRFDAVIVGAGHNGLVAATLLARAGLAVLVLEGRDEVGGAAVSGSPFPGVEARLSRYSCLVSLFPAALLRSLGVAVELRPRAVSSYTPQGASGLLVGDDRDLTRASMTRATGDPRAFAAWERFHAMLGGVARRLFPTLTRPLLPREEVRRLLDDGAAWRALFEEPLSAVLERTFSSDLLRGLVLTDATIGTFRPGRRSVPAPEPVLSLSRDRQRNRPVGRSRGRHGRAQRGARGRGPSRGGEDHHRGRDRGHRHRRGEGRGRERRGKEEAVAATLRSLDSVLAEPPRGLPAAHRGGDAVLRGADADRARSRSRDAGRSHLPSQPRLALRRMRARGRHLGRRDEVAQRLAVRGRRAPRRRRERDSRTQAPRGRCSQPGDLIRRAQRKFRLRSGSMYVEGKLIQRSAQ